MLTLLACAVLQSATLQEAKGQSADAPKSHLGKLSDWKSTIGGREAAPEAWTDSGGGFFETHVDKAELFRPLPIPNKAEIRVVLESTHQMSFQLGLTGNPGRRTFYLETWDDHLVGLAAEEFVEVRKLPRGAHRRTVRLFVDRDADRCYFFDKTGRRELPAGPITEPGIRLRNAGRHLALRNIFILPWDGEEPKPLPKTVGETVLYAGPDFGEDWKLSGPQEFPGQWSSTPNGGLATVTRQAHAFRELKVPDEMELEVIFRSPSRSKVDMGFEEHRPDLTFTVANGQISVLRSTGALTFDFPEGRRVPFTLRLFGTRKDGHRSYRLVTAGGRTIGEVPPDTKRPPRRNPRVALENWEPREGLYFRNSGGVLIIDKIRLSPWDRSDPPPVPGQ